MQSALTIIPIPLFAIETPPPSAELPDQGFALAFDDGLITPESETSLPESPAVGPLLPLLWNGPIMSLPSVVPSEVEEGGKTALLDDAVATVPGRGSVALDALPVDAALGDTVPEIDDAPAIPTGLLPEGLVQRANLRLPSQSKGDQARLLSGSAGQPDAPVDLLSEQEPKGNWSNEAIASVTPRPVMSDARIDTVAAAESVSDNAALAKTFQESVVEGHPAASVAHIADLEFESSDLADTEPKGQPARSEPLSGHTRRIDRDAGRADLDAPVKADDASSLEPMKAPAPHRSYVGESTESPTVTLQEEPLDSQTRPASFWERFFAGLTAPNGVTVLQEDHGAGFGPVDLTSDSVAAATVVLAPAETLVNQYVVPEVDLPHGPSRLADLAKPTTKDPSPVDSVALQPLPDKQTGPMPPISLPDGENGLLDSREQFDPALLSGAFLQFSSGFSAAPGPPSLSSLPVQQIAAQLATVLVDVSDKVTELALSPEELGRVSLRLEPDAANPDRMTVLINVERPETLDLFRRHAGELADAIKAAGYAGADISFGQHGQGGSPDQRPRENTFGSGRLSEDQTPVTPARREVVGATLDLRL